MMPRALRTPDRKPLFYFCKCGELPWRLEHPTDLPLAPTFPKTPARLVLRAALIAQEGIIPRLGRLRQLYLFITLRFR